MPARFPTLIGAILVALLFLAAPTGIPRAGAYDPTWEPADVVDTGAIDISSSSGSAMAHTPQWSPWSSRNEWHVLYAKAGKIWHAALLPTGWLAPELISSANDTARDPKIAFAATRMIAVWEDDRRGHPEVWSRMWDGTTWGAESCLTDDAVPSRMPVVAGSYDGGFLVWQEGEDGGTQIRGRFWDGSIWRSPVDASGSSSYSIEPTITFCPALSMYFVAWADGRDGDPEIYMREYSEWTGFGGLLRVTNLPGSCRRPSIHSEDCCGDVIEEHALLAFENDQTGVVETWTACYEFEAIEDVVRISPDDGRASERPQVNGYTYVVSGMLGGAIPRYFVTWTEAGSPGARQHTLGNIRICGSPERTEILSTVGLGTSAIAGSDRYPYSSLVAAWLEERDGQRGLIAKRGSILDCEDFTFAGPRAILLSPGGTPGNTIAVTNHCGGTGPVEGVEIDFSFTETLESHLIWDAQQIHPVFPPQYTQPDGTTNFALRGGGCWTGGIARVQTRGGVEVLRWDGAKSPDVNGDCAVLTDDLAYVRLRVGTTDYCADLDGSGTVTQTDVSIVQAAMGQLCSQLAGIEEPTDAQPLLQVRPNPSRGEVTFAFAATGESPVYVEIFDAAGRLVRTWTDARSSLQSGNLVWDGRDTVGRDAPSGVYFVRGRARARDACSTFLIAR